MKLILSLSVLLSSFAFAQSQSDFLEAWKGFSAPEIMSSGFIHDFKALPLSGMIKIGPKAWSGDYWSSKKGSINIRWNSPAKEGFDYKSPTKEQAKLMSVEELAMLAPTEKYDLMAGRYDYPLKKEVDGIASKMAQDWAGICNGWSPAAIFHNEPTPKLVTNQDGIQVPFGSGDIKALISYFYAYYVDTDVDQVGLRCFFGSWLGGARGCSDDLNAGAFHIIMTNKLALQGEGFITDVDRFSEVWNQPTVGYKSVILAHNLAPSKDAAKLAVKEVRISTELYYVDEAEPTWLPIIGTEKQKIEKKTFQYRVELDSEGRIVGGEWESRERPDFIWSREPARPENFSGLLTDLPKLLNDQE